MKNIFVLCAAMFAFMFVDAQVHVVAPNGDVGVGTMTPGATLHVDREGPVSFKLTNSQVSPNNYISIVHNNANTSVITKSSDSGSALIDINPSPLDGTSSSMFRFFRTTNTTGDVFFQVHTGDGTGSWNTRMLGNGDTYLNKNVGYVGIGTTSPTHMLDVAGTVGHMGLTNTSDKRLKKNIKKFDLGLETILAIDPVTFQYNDILKASNGKTQIGIIAQELQKVAPVMVDEFTHIKHDSKMNVIEEETYLNVQTDGIQFILVNAIKDQQAIIDAKEERIAQLESDFEELKNMINDMKNISGNINHTEVNLTYEDFASLEQNRPNPFNGSTMVEYVIPSKAQSATMNIVDMSGKVLKQITLNHVGQGTLELNAFNMPSGTYMYELVVDGKKVSSKTMVLQN